MLPDEKKLTPAQSALLSFSSHLEASNIYQSLNTTLGLSIANYLHPKEREDALAMAPGNVLDAWYFTLELMMHLHMIAVEKQLPK